MTLRIDGALVPPSAQVSADAQPTPAAAVSSEPSPFARFLAGLGQNVDRGAAMMEGVTSGAAVGADPATLIALQAGIYRYSEAVDLAGKLVDRGGNAVRTVLQAGH